MSKKVPLYIDGEFRASKTESWIPVTNPATQEVIAEAPCATQDEMEAAVASAREAFKTWKEVPVSER
ncbi:aldehyde dehydrogenase family protein, partial [uncultured Idiomarina sp.]